MGFLGGRGFRRFTVLICLKDIHYFLSVNWLVCLFWVGEGGELRLKTPRLQTQNMDTDHRKETFNSLMPGIG